nr:MAG TPA: hypothetical protein [Caudoviricetes sp.]
MKLKPAGRRPHELAKLSRLCGGFVHLRCRNPPEPVRFDIERRGSAALETPRGQKPAAPRPREGGAKILEFFKRRERSYKLLHVQRSI